MKTVTTREAQHHLSRVLEMVAAGEEVLITRRGKAVAKMTAYVPEDPTKKKVDWVEAIRERDEALGDLPRYEGSLMEELRAEERS